MRSPFIPLTIAFMMGIATARALSLSPLLWGTTALLSLSAGWLVFSLLRKMRLSFSFLLLATAFIGAGLFAQRDLRYEAAPLRQTSIQDYTDFSGTLIRSPVPGLGSTTLILDVDTITTEGREQPTQGHLRLTCKDSPESGPLAGLFVGDRIRVSAQLTSLEGFRNFGVPTGEFHFKSLNIHNRAYTKSPLLVEKTASGSSLSPVRRISILRQGIRAAIERAFPSPDLGGVSVQGAVLEALLLGARDRLDDSILLPLQEAGLFHLFALSGAHIAIISWLLFSALRLIQIPKRWAYLALMITLVLYVLLVEGRPSIFRAAIMTLTLLLGKLIWRDVHLFNILALSAFILLLVNPFSLFTLGFQLTYIATLSILLLYPVLNRYLPKLPLRLSEIFALSLSALIGVLPLVAQAFNRVTFSSLILNFAALPLVGLIMVGGYLCLGLGILSDALVSITAVGVRFLIDLLLALPGLIEGTHLSWRIPTPPFPLIPAYFTFLLLGLAARRKILKAGLGLCFAASAALLISSPFSASSPRFRVTFLDVGQGESTLIEFPGSRKMLIDGGGTFDGSFDLGEHVVSPFLWRRGIKAIDVMVLTHAHPDHLKGLKSVARNFKIKEFWEANRPENQEDYLELMEELGDTARRRGVFRGFSSKIGGVTVDVLHPGEGSAVVPEIHNDQSMVLRFSFGETAVLIPGDIGVGPEESLLSSGAPLTSQILQSPHHGSRTSSSLRFLESVRPEVIVISVGARNPFGLPDPAILDRYEQWSELVLRTDVHGAVEVESDGRNLSLRTYRGETWNNQPVRRPAAGRIPLERPPGGR